MASNTRFFDDFFKCNSPEVSTSFLKAMCLPTKVEDILRLYYVEHKEQKQLADMLNIEERTVRARLEHSRNICQAKVIGWLSQRFSCKST